MKLHIAPGSKPSSPQIEVETHPRAHLADILAAYFTRRYGQTKYGATGTPVKGTRVVTIGRGGYDHHADPKSEKCEADEVARDLGIEGRPDLQPVLTYTRNVDLGGAGKGILKPGRVVELLYDVYADQPQRVWHWATAFIEASIEAASEGRGITEPDLIVFLLVWRAYDRVACEFSPEVRENLEQFLSRTTLETELKPFSLHSCAGLLWWKFRQLPESQRSKSVIQWIADAIRAELVRQRDVLNAKREFDEEFERDGGRFREILLTVRGEEVGYFFARSDNVRVHSFLFWDTDAVILVAVRRSNGHVQIFRRRDCWPRVRIHYIVALIRDRERLKRGLSPVTWDELISPHGPEGDCWFFHQQAQWLLNGSLTAPDEEPTVLSDDEIIECLIQGLNDAHEEFRHEFRRTRGGFRE